MSTRTDRLRTNTRWMIFALACLASWLNYVHRYSWGVVKPKLQAEYKINDADMGWLDGAFNLTYALGQFPGGLAGDKFGPRLVIPVMAVLWSLVVAAPALVTGFWKLYVIRLLFGVTQAAAYPNLGKVTKSWFPSTVRTSVQGMVASLSGRAGAACASLIVATLLMGTLNLSWQNALWTIAVAGIVFAVAFRLLFRNSPAEHPWANTAEVELISDEGPTASTEPDSTEVSDNAADESEASVEARPQARFVWNRTNVRYLTIFLCASFCSSYADNLFVFWMPSYLSQEKGFDPVSMGVFASLPLFGGALGGMCGGFVNDALIRRLGNRRRARRLVAATGKVIAAVLIGVSLLPEDGRVVMVVLFFCKFFSDMSQPTWWGTVTDIGGPASGRVFGIVNTFGSIGAFIAGPAMGYVKQAYGWGMLFSFVGFAYILTAVWWGQVDCTQKLVVEESGRVGND